MAAECSLNITRTLLAALKPAEHLLLMHRQAVRTGLVPQQTTPDALVGTIRTFAAALRINYRPEKTYALPTNLVLLADASAEGHEQEHRFVQTATDWRRWVPELDVWRGAGNHMTVLKSANASILARWLQSKLNATSNPWSPAIEN
jgi:thioesterase domain-containing protein